MKCIWLTILCLLCAVNIYANKIDELKTDNDVTAFINSFQQKKSKHLVVQTDEEILKSDALSQLAHAKNWQKADLNADGLTDLLVNTYYSTGYAPYVVMDKGNGTFKVLTLHYAGNELAKIERINNQAVILFYATKIGTFPQNTPSFNRKNLTTIDTLVYKFESFVEYNPNPVIKNVTEITFKTDMCFGTCPVFSIEMNANGRATYTGGKFNEDEGFFKGRVSTKNMKPFFDVINYLDFTKIKDDYNVGWTDFPTCWLTIKFKDGTTKSIRDYGELGTFGLRKLYALFSQLKTDQVWYEQ